MKRCSCRPKRCLAVLAILLLVCGCTQDGGQTSLLRDDFSDPGSGWGEDRRDEFDRGYDEDGEYFFELYEPDWLAWARPGKKYDDVRVQVDATLVSDPPEGHYGLLCRYASPNDFYYFAISPDGYYAIFRRVDGGELEVLTGSGKGMLPSSDIRVGGQVNRIAAVCSGNSLSLYANGDLLAVVTDDAHARGDVGVAAASGPLGDTHVRFDDFVVTAP